MRLEAIVFDFDGTLVDTESPWYRAAGELYARHGAALRLEEWARGIGTAPEAFDAVLELERLVGRPLDRGAATAWYHARVRELVRGAGLRPGVQALLREARALAVRLAIASSSDRGWVTGHLERLGLSRAFAAICTQEDVPNVKPDPALYRLALRRLGVSAGGAVAVEDSPNGARAALGAGLRCVVVPNDTTRPLPFPAGSTRLETLEGVGVDALVRAVPSGEKG